MSDAVELAAAAIPQAAAASYPGGARSRPGAALHPVTTVLSAVIAAGSVLAAVAAVWSTAAAAAWVLQQVTVSDHVAQTSGAYLALAVLGGSAAAGVFGGRRLRYYRRERAAERARWAASEPEFAVALAAKRAEPVKTPKRALPRPAGMPLS